MATLMSRSGSIPTRLLGHHFLSHRQSEVTFAGSNGYSIANEIFLRPLQPINEGITIAAFVLFAAQLIFAVNFIGSWFTGEKAEDNPWEDNSLEWTVPSPAPHGNFATTPIVYRGPYEYRSPLVERDFLPQTVKLPTDTPPATSPAGD